MRVGVIGAGNWGKNLVRNFAAIDAVDLAVVADRNPAALERISGAYPGTATTSTDDKIISDESIEAVVIATPAPGHFALAQRALTAGKHVYCEKPLTLAAADAKALVDLAKAKNRVLMVGHLLEYHPAVLKMKQMIDDGEVGEPRYIYTQRINLGVVRKEENAWWSLAPHDISVIQFLFGSAPTSVSACGQCYLQPGVEDVVFATLKFESGRMAHIHCSWLDPHKIRKMTLVGSQKMVTFDDMAAAEKVRIYDKGADVKAGVESFAEAISLRVGDITIPKLAGGEPLRTECQHFVDCVREGKAPRSDGLDGLRVVQVLEAGSESLRQGGAPVAIS